MKVKVKFKNEEAKRLYLEASENKTIFPFKKHGSDFCYDAVAVSCEEIAPNVYKYGLGISAQIVRDKGGRRQKFLFRYNCSSTLIYL